MELANILIVPATAALLVYAVGGTLSIAMLTSMIATSFLLIVGTIAWKTVVGI